MSYAKVIVDINTSYTDRLFTYESDIPDLKIGDKVCVPFGKSARDAYVFEILSELPEEDFEYREKIKKIESRDTEISLSPEVIKLCKWMKRRYFCRMIQAIKCFLPAKAGKKRKESNPIKRFESETYEEKELTAEQAHAVSKISTNISDNNHAVFLLHGVTNSGKTEVYIQGAEIAVAKKKNVILIVPEISLTMQTIERFIGKFGEENVAILHSKLTARERHDQWKRISSGEVQIIIGTRSALFAPAPNLGLIIVDEEHESSYKSEYTPKYHGVEVAVERGRLEKSTVILGSATPSIGSYYKTQTVGTHDGYKNPSEPYQLISLQKTYNDKPLAEIEVVDMRYELKTGNRSIFSSDLHDAIDETVKKGKQVILFVNRRGYATFISCRNCGHVVKCKECDIALTYHKATGKAHCHYCGRKEVMPKICPSCGSKYIKQFGIGTEKIEESMHEFFSDLSIQRFDVDSTKTVHETQKILKNFKKGNIDVLIGTQIVAKGLDFDNVGLVGVVAADTSLNIPDYRSGERTFQLISQVAGRAGRSDGLGKVIVQSYHPDHYAIIAAANRDYKEFYMQEIQLRELTEYPPYSDLIQISVSAGADDLAYESIKQAYKIITSECNMELLNYVLNIQKNPRNDFKKYSYQFIIKATMENRKELYRIIWSMKEQFDLEKKELSIEVNPYSLY